MRTTRRDRLEHAAKRATLQWFDYRKRHYAMWNDPAFTSEQLRRSMQVYRHYYQRMQRLQDAWAREVGL